MTVAELIETLHRLCGDPSSGVTMSTKVALEHPDGGQSELVTSVYPYRHWIDWVDNQPQKASTVALVSSVPDDFAKK